MTNTELQKKAEDYKAQLKSLYFLSEDQLKLVQAGYVDGYKDCERNNSSSEIDFKDLNRELTSIRKNIIEKYNLSCKTCAHQKGTRCKSKTLCIVKDAIFYSSYVAKERGEQSTL